MEEGTHFIQGSKNICQRQLLLSILELEEELGNIAGGLFWNISSAGKLLLCWKSEYITDENIWSWQIWKVVTCRWNIKFGKEKWRMNVNLCRCTDTPNTVNREKPRIISRGSSFRWEALFCFLLISSQFIQDKRWRKLLMFRYSGRTQKQMQEHVRENFVKRQSFQRWFLSFLPPIFLNQKSC